MSVYFEIQADDVARAKSFYEKVFGWGFERNQFAPIEYYWIRHENLGGGLLARPVPKPQGMCGTNAFCCSFETDDIDAVSARIMANGGVVAMPKFPIQGVCWHAYFLDTEGNVFGIFQPDENAK